MQFELLRRQFFRLDGFHHYPRRLDRAFIFFRQTTIPDLNSAGHTEAPLGSNRVGSEVFVLHKFNSLGQWSIPQYEATKRYRCKIHGALSDSKVFEAPKEPLSRNRVLLYFRTKI
jgi:hypothetical protein